MEKKEMLFILIFIGQFCSVPLFAQVFGLELIKNSDLSVEAPLGLNCGELWNYSKGHTGGEVKLATTLFAEKSEKYAIGMCSTFFFNNYLFVREEIQDFYIRGITEGIWCDFLVPGNFFIRSELYGGFAVTKIKAQSIYESEIDNNYNCFVFGTNAILRKKIFRAGPADIYGNCGLNIRFLAEENHTNSNISLMAGLTVKAGKK